MERIHNAIEFCGVSLVFGEQVILNRVSFGVRLGESQYGRLRNGPIHFTAPVLGLLKPDSGRIFADGEEIIHYSGEQMMRQKIERSAWPFRNEHSLIASRFTTMWLTGCANSESRNQRSSLL